MKNKVIQSKKISDTDDNYGIVWYDFIKMMIKEKYGSIINFINAYGNNPNKVFRDINSDYKIIPFDLRETLQKIYSEKAVKGVA